MQGYCERVCLHLGISSYMIYATTTSTALLARMQAVASVLVKTIAPVSLEQMITQNGKPNERNDLWPQAKRSLPVKHVQIRPFNPIQSLPPCSLKTVRIKLSQKKKDKNGWRRRIFPWGKRRRIIVIFDKQQSRPLVECKNRSNKQARK